MPFGATRNVLIFYKTLTVHSSRRNAVKLRESSRYARIFQVKISVAMVQRVARRLQVTKSLIGHCLYQISTEVRDHVGNESNEGVLSSSGSGSISGSGSGSG